MNIDVVSVALSRRGIICHRQPSPIILQCEGKMSQRTSCMSTTPDKSAMVSRGAVNDTFTVASTCFARTMPGPIANQRSHRIQPQYFVYVLIVLIALEFDIPARHTMRPQTIHSRYCNALKMGDGP